MAKLTQEEAQLLQELQDMVTATKVPQRTISVEIDTKVSALAETPFERLREAYAVANAAFKEIYQALKVADQRFELECTTPQLADTMIALNETTKLVEDLQKECRRLLKKMTECICDRHSRDPNAKASVTGEYGRVEPKIKYRGHLPTFEREPEDYNALCDWLGIHERVRNRGKLLVNEQEIRTKIVDIEYLAYQDYLDYCVSQGIELPSFITKWASYQECVAKIVKKVDLL